jgi:hypothetical protein
VAHANAVCTGISNAPIPSAPAKNATRSNSLMGSSDLAGMEAAHQDEVTTLDWVGAESELRRK